MALRALLLYYWPYGHQRPIAGPTGLITLLLALTGHVTLSLALTAMLHYYWPDGPYHTVAGPTGLITLLLALRA